MRIIRMFLLALALAVPVAGFGQTAEQLEIFRNLTPEQQQAVLRQMEGSTGAATGAPAGPASGTQRTPEAGAEVERRNASKVTTETPPIPVLLAEDVVLVQVSPGTKPDDPLESERLDKLVELIQSRNPYRLDREAQLNLPGFAPVAVGGLSDLQASQRLSVEPTLRGLKLSLTRLPLQLSGVRGLKPFGYDLFDAAEGSFAPVTDVPVPSDYVVGPGDRFTVQLFGIQNRSLSLVVNREGVVNFPELGPIRVGGLAFTAARRLIESSVANRMTGIRADVGMADARTIRVFVVGEVRVSGSYAVSGLATITTALFASGGVKPIGSLRNIQLKRQGEVVRSFDLYDLLVRGDTSGDAKLQAGDVIFIPPVGPTVSVTGEVKRPAIYELRGEASVDDVVRTAGGYTPNADSGRANLTRVDEASRRVVLDLNLKEAAGRAMRLQNGDVLRVAALRPQLDSGVQLEGFVYRDGPVAWRQGLRLTQVIGSVDELKPGADQHYVLIRRESGPQRIVSVLSADLTAALAAPGSAADVMLEPRDRITVFELAPGRERIIRPLLDELKLQSGLARPTEEVKVGGRVKVPGEYPLEAGMRVSDLLRAGGDLDAAAYGAEAELTRYVVDASGVRRNEIVVVNLERVRAGDAAANLALQPFDYLLIKETPDWASQDTITLRGEVKFPGTFTIRKGETLHAVLERAGGLTDQAFPEGSAFTRTDLKLLEQQQLDRLAERMRADLVAISIQAVRAGRSDAAETMLAGQSLVTELQTAKATGRFVIDLPGLLEEPVGSEKDVVLRAGDELVIPRRRQEVTVIGEVQNSSSHLYAKKLDRSDYIAMSGGTTTRADKRRIYVVRADGRVATRSGAGGIVVKTGDTIVVPVDAERMPRLPFWQAVTQILYNVAVSVAAVNSF